jgi:hypothetical protein
MQSYKFQPFLSHGMGIGIPNYANVLTQFVIIGAVDRWQSACYL